MQFFFQQFVDNITYAIIKQIGLDANKLSETRNVVRNRMKNCPLFTQDLFFNNVNELKESINSFIDSCLEEVLEKIV